MSEWIKTQIHFLRHGLPEGEDCFRGRTDFPLTTEGLLQMIQKSEHFSGIDLVISSPLQRCCVFAKEYTQQCQIPLIIDNQWQEIDFGDWDGCSKHELWEASPTLLDAYWLDPWHITPPKGEALIDFDHRIQAAWQKVLLQHKGKNILIVTHGGVMKQIFRFCLSMPKNTDYLYRIHLPYAAYGSISVTHGQNGESWPVLNWH